MVEFALTFPVVFLILLVILELGFAFNAYVTVVYAARQGARAGAVYQYQQGCAPASLPPPDNTVRKSNDLNREQGYLEGCGLPRYYTENIRDTVANSLGALNNGAWTMQVTYSPDPPLQSNRTGDLLSVTVTYPYRFLTPVLNNGGITIKAQASHRIEP